MIEHKHPAWDVSLGRNWAHARKSQTFSSPALENTSGKSPLDGQLYLSSHLPHPVFSIWSNCQLSAEWLDPVAVPIGVGLVLGLKTHGLDLTHSPPLLGEWLYMPVSDEATLELAIKWCRGVGGWAGATIGNWQEERRRRRAILIPQLRSVSPPFSSSSLSLSSLLFDGNDDRS